jgi:adenylate kinase family enzyme
MAYKRNITLEVMVGLPGSGKTTLAKELESKNRYQNKAIHLDASFELQDYRRANEQDKARIIRNIISNSINSQRVSKVILDGLFLTYDDVVRVIKATHRLFDCVNVVVHQWNEDRDTCIKNDGGRREVSSTNTILNAQYELIDGIELEKIIKASGCENVRVSKVVKHKVILKPDWERYFRGKIYVYDDGKIRSDKWTTGGSYGSCWGDRLTPVTPDDQPEFDVLDELLCDICPTITFLQYKKIMKSCVEFEESYESDYYGGGCSYKNYVCDMKKLYEMLNDFGYTVHTD